jgi:hypothetical protein
MILSEISTIRASVIWNTVHLPHTYAFMAHDDNVGRQARSVVCRRVDQSGPAEHDKGG